MTPSMGVKPKRGARGLCSTRIPNVCPDSRYMRIINATAAQLSISDSPAGLDSYYCALLLDGQLLPNHSYDDISIAQLLSIPSSDSLTFPTLPSTSLETSGPPLMVSYTSEVGVCLNIVAGVGRELPLYLNSFLFVGWCFYICVKQCL